jgi:TetR/AcrR family transcriptional regulator, regulator of cefoperazone and chloramphenicol sensitivity
MKTKSKAKAKKRSQPETKAKLLKAALDVFSKEGYDAATTRRISKKAGVNESLINRYFGGKLGLFWALKQQYKDNLLQQLLSYGESENIEEELTRFIEYRVRYTKQYKKFFKLSLSRAIVDPKLREDVRTYASMKPPALVERFEHFRRKGEIRKDVDLEQLVGILHATSFAFSILVHAIECLPMEDAEKLIKAATNYLAKGLSPKG